jgi:hypothetical protein
MRGFNASRKLDNNNIQDRSLLLLYKEVIEQIREKFPLIGHYLEIIYRDTESVLEEIRNYTYDSLLKKDRIFFEKK